MPLEETANIIISTKFEVDITIRHMATALLVRIHYMTSCPWHLTFWPRTVLVHGRSRGQPQY